VSNWFHHIFQWIHLHPYWGIAAAFLIAFGESVPIIGTIVPSSVMMTAVGVLIGTNLIPLPITLVMAILGAFLGDCVGYATGRRFKVGIHQVWPFRKYPSILRHGENFFSKHAGKSILVGRFIGATRAITPLTAGILGMSLKRFLANDSIAAILWAPVYLLPGYLLGKASLALPPEIATKLILLVLLISILFWLLVLVVKWIIKYSHRYLHKYSRLLWITQKPTGFIHRMRQVLKTPHSFTLSIMTSVFALVFLFILICVISHHILTIPNDNLYHFFRGLRNPALDHVAIFITAFGKVTVLLPMMIVVFVTLWLTRQRRLAWHWLLLFIISAAVVWFFRHVYYYPRPPGIALIKSSSSFPSGHVVLSTICYGFLAWLAAQRFHKARTWIYTAAILWIIIIAISRLYLGDHWFSDVLGAFFLGMTLMGCMLVSWRRHVVLFLRPMWPLCLAVISLFIAWAIYLTFYSAQVLQASRPVWPTYHLSQNLWWEKRTPVISIVRDNRFGVPVAEMNLEWAGNLSQIKQKLLATGWFPTAHPKATQLLNQLKKEKKINRLAIFPLVYDDQKPVVKLLKPMKQGMPIVLRLWRSHVFLIPGQTPVWVGSLTYLRPLEHLFFHNVHRRAPEKAALGALAPVLKTLLFKPVYPDSTDFSQHALVYDSVKPYLILIQ